MLGPESVRLPKVQLLCYRAFFFVCFVSFSIDQYMIQIDEIKRIKYNEIILDAFKMKMKSWSSKISSVILH